MRVVASKDIAARSLRLVPLVRSTAALTFKASTVWPLPVDVLDGEEPAVSVFVQGGSNVPKPPALASASVERVPGSARTDHEWRPSDFPWPFWFVQRSGNKTECNCVLERCTTRHVSTCQVSATAGAPDCVVDSVEVTVPIMTNAQDIRAGQELVVFWQAVEKAKTPTKAKTWQHQAKSELQKVLKGKSV